MATYTSSFTNPYPNGWQDSPDQTTPITAEALQAHTDAIQAIDNYLSENPIPDSGGTTDYESLENKPTINGVEIIGNLTAEDLGLGNGSGTTDYNDLENKPSINGTELSGDITLDIPTKVSELENDAGYLKEIPEQSYNDLTDKPKINGVEIVGDLTSEDLGLGGGSSSSTSTLSDLTDVELTSLANGQGLFYDGELQKWVNGDVVSGGTSISNIEYYSVSNTVTTTSSSSNPTKISELELSEGIYILSGSFLSETSGLRYLLEFHDDINGSLWAPTSAYDNSGYVNGTLTSIVKITEKKTISFRIYTSKSISINGTFKAVRLGSVNSGGSTLTNYSTEEQVVGTWIDGRNIYQKSYNLSLDIEAIVLLDDSIKHGSNELIKIDGTWVIGGFEWTSTSVAQASIFGKSKYETNEVEPPDIYLDVDGLYLKSNTSIYGFEANVTIQYTKTTDTL